MLTEVTDTEDVNKIDPIFTIELEKDKQGRIGIGIGGGSSSNCPCLYIVQIFENSPASRDKILEIGDEILAINGDVSNKDKVSVASKIRGCQGPVRITIKKFHLAFEQYQFFDLNIALKKLKHRIVDSIDDKTADSLGLSRAVLVNDQLKKFQDQVENSENFCRSLIGRLECLLVDYNEEQRYLNDVGSLLIDVAGQNSTESDESMHICTIGQIHKSLGREQSTLNQNVLKLIQDLKVQLEQAIPDTKETINKYLDSKYEYLSFCLRVKEMEDEEASLISAGEHLERMRDGNLEYRIVLKLREESRIKFIKGRNQALGKVELLEERRARELAVLLQTYLKIITKTRENNLSVVKGCEQLLSS